MFPNARKNELTVEDLGTELLVYDSSNHKTHCLGPAAATVWRHCDGETTVEEMTGHLRKTTPSADDEAVWLILHRLGKLGLLESPVAPPPGAMYSSRREMAVKVLGFGGMAALLATTIVAPTAAQTQSRPPLDGCPNCDDE